VLTLEEKLQRAAILYGEQQKKANASKATADRIAFVQAELELCEAAQAFYVHYAFEREPKHVERRRKKS